MLRTTLRQAAESKIAAGPGSRQFLFKGLSWRVSAIPEKAPGELNFGWPVGRRPRRGFGQDDAAGWACGLEDEMVRGIYFRRSEAERAHRRHSPGPFSPRNHSFKKDGYSIQRAKQRQDAEIALRIEYHLQFNWTDECVFQAIVDGVSG